MTRLPNDSRRVNHPPHVLTFLICWLAIGLSCGCTRQTAPEFTLREEAEAFESPIPKQIQDALLEKCGTPASPKLLGDEAIAPEVLKRGAAVYQRRCEQCHGVNGDGNGLAAKYLNPKPRDYRKGIFKFTALEYGSRPRRADLMRTLRRGVTGTAMPSFDMLSQEDLEAVVEYVLVLTRRGELELKLIELAEVEGELNDELIDTGVDEVLAFWRNTDEKVVMPQTPMPEFSEASIAKGRELFLNNACIKCHGPTGRGGFLGNVEIAADAWGHKTAAADLTSGMFHGGGRPIDLYRRIYTGIYGSPMPGFASTFAQDPDAIWYLVHYISDMGQRRRRHEPPVDPAAEAAAAKTAAADTAAADGEANDGRAADSGAKEDASK